MLKILIKSFILLIAISLTTIIIYSIKPPNKNSYLAAIQDKHDRLESIQSPKIVFIGGSNLAFSLDSKLIEEHTGYNVYNMGLQISIGLEFMLEEVKPYIKKGDIFVIVPEYEHFYGILCGGNTLTLCTMIEHEPRLIKLSDSPQLFYSFITQYIRVMQNKVYVSCKLLPDVDTVNTRLGFNNYGDFLLHIESEHINKENKVDITKQKLTRYEDKPFDTRAVSVLNRFGNYAKKQNARVFFLYPCLPKYHYNKYINRITFVFNELNNKLNFQILSEPIDYVFPETFFYKSIYHLNADGRKIRTEKTLSDLLEAINF